MATWGMSPTSLSRSRTIAPGSWTEVTSGSIAARAALGKRSSAGDHWCAWSSADSDGVGQWRVEDAPVAARRGTPTLLGLLVVNTRVVVVDDVADIRWLLRAALNADGRFEVVGEAGDGRECVEVVKLTRPDVAVIDLRMPRMDGLEAAAEIAQVSPETRIVIFSAVGEAAVVAAARGAGVAGFVNKGVPPKAILDAVALAAAS